MDVSLSDPVDRADIEIQRTIDLGIANARAALKVHKLPPKRSCYNCKEPFPNDPEKLFCDDDCSDDYEQLKRNGKL